MTALPPPVPLEHPTGDPVALADVVDAVTGAAFRIGLLEAHLGGPAASAPGWLGADASAAEGQLGVVAGLTRAVHHAVTAAVGRLAAHRDLLLDCRRRIGALRAAQEHDYAVAAAGPVLLPGSAVGQTAGPVLEDLAAAEQARRREHAALLAEVADDAAATARVLAGASEVVGGRGRRGDADRVLAHLAVELPGWGEGELAGRGAGLARDLTDGPVSPKAMEELARAAAPFAGTAAFARAFLTVAGADGVRFLFAGLGQEPAGASSTALALLLATVWGAAELRDAADDPLGAVVAASYVDPADTDRAADVVALGMGAVLAAGRAGREGAVPFATAASWGRQFLARERTQGAAAARIPAAVLDPVETVVEVLAAAGDRGAAATLLADRQSWDAVLARSWPDDGAALGRVVQLAGAEPGAAGLGSVRSGLAALGSGLSPDDPGLWTVDRTTAGTIAPALAQGVAEHVGAAAHLLTTGSAGPLPGSSDDALRGLGYLTIDRAAAAAVQEALAAWAAGAPTPRSLDPLPSTVAVVTGAYVAVQEYGQRLAYALHGHEAMSAAVDRQLSWSILAVTLELATFRRAEVLSTLEPFFARLLNADGTWENGPDRGLRFDRADAVAAARALLPPEQLASVASAQRQAAAAFAATAESLGVPLPPVPDDWSLWESLVEDLAGRRRDTGRLPR